MKQIGPKLTLGEALFFRKLNFIGKCCCPSCGIALANSAALSYYTDNKKCIECNTDPSSAITDVTQYQ